MINYLLLLLFSCPLVFMGSFCLVVEGSCNLEMIQMCEKLSKREVLMFCFVGSSCEGVDFNQ